MTQQLSRHGIGASEIAAIAGLNPHCSPWDIWCRKVGDAPDVEPTEAMEWGNRLEPAIRQKYCDDTGYHVMVPKESMFHSTMPWARATPDGIVTNYPDLGWSHLFQAKNVGTWVERAWSAAPPVYVQIQESWEMHVTRLQRADVGVLIGGNEFRIYSIHRDDRVIDDLVTVAQDFWRRVETRKPPPVDDSDACRQHFEKRLKREAIELVADVETEQLFAEWYALTQQQKQAKKRVETIRNLVRQQMAEAEATIIKSTIGAAKMSQPSEPATVDVVNWKHVAELLGSTKCTPDEFAELVRAATSTLTPEPKKPTLYAPREWAKETL